MADHQNINAIIMAAGMSTRFVPLSLEQPKALLELNGERLIERQIRQIRESGITDITVVTGYMAEKFDYLQKKHDVQIVYNHDYQTKNNHSSLYAARHKLKDTFICSADNYFTENIFTDRPKYSYYAAEYSEQYTDEWCMETDKNCMITGVRIGGENCLYMKGHVFLTRAFTQRLIPLLEKAYDDPGCCDLFWEDIYIRHIHEFELYARQYTPGIIYEFDSLSELLSFSPDYPLEKKSRWISYLCRKFQTTADRLGDFFPLKKNGIVTGFSCIYNGITYSFSEMEDDINEQRNESEQ